MYLQELPPPGSYDVSQSYQKSQIRSDRAKPRTDDASRKAGSFLTSASRFAPARDTVVARPDLENPGKDENKHFSEEFLK